MDISSEQLDRLSTSLRAGEYSLLLGAAASLGSKNAAGQDIPLADDYRVELCTLKGAKTSHSLQRVYQTLDEHEVAKNVTARFAGCRPGPALKAIPSFIWRRIYTLNIDDALEAAYAEGDPYQTLISRNYRDRYEEVYSRAEIPIIHLHGYVQKPEDGYVFSREAYLNIIKTANPWMVVLSQSIAVDPFIIMGSSLDEVDLDFFLSLRSQATARSDRGPSILIEPYGDLITDRECARLGLIRYPGTAEEFMNYLSHEVAQRPRPADLVAPDDKALFPSDVETADFAAFFSDFERVPQAVEADTHDARFFFGHQPSWSDLTLQYDVARTGTSNISQAIAGVFDGRSDDRLLILNDQTGVGKTTVIRRVAFDLARQGVTVLSCYATSRLEPRLTAAMLNKIVGRTVVVIDNIADHIYPIESIISLVTKKDIVFLGAERSYRRKFLSDALSGTDWRTIRLPEISRTEIHQLIDTYFQAGLLGDESLIERPDSAISSLQQDPIAIASCRILNNLRPLDRIIVSLFTEVTALEKRRYLTAALAQFCGNSGVRISVLSAAAGGVGLNQQFSALRPLPLGFSDRSNNYVVPLNTTLGSRVLELASEDTPQEIYDVFVRLAEAIAPLVSRNAIRQRTPEARLSGRLFDYDQVVERFLGDRAQDFFEDIKESWQWNSRYWEQVALIYLTRAQRRGLGHAESVEDLEMALQHARHAVVIERHPLTLTTFAKVSLAYIERSGGWSTEIFEEAISELNEAIRMERRRSRHNVQPYVVMLRGFLTAPAQSQIAESILVELRKRIGEAKRLFRRDAEVAALVADVQDKYMMQ